MRVVLFTLPLVALSSLGIVSIRSAQVANPSDGWMTEFSEAESLAKKSGRPLLIHFHAEWCGPCRKMDREVLNDPSVLEELSRRFVAVKVNADHHKDLVERFGIDSLPTDVIVDPQGRVLARSVGFTKRADYLALARRVDTEPDTPPHVFLAKDRRIRPGQSNGRNQDESNGDPNTAGGGNAGNGSRQPHVGLEGHCPVTLRDSGEWKIGSTKYGQRYQGIVYYLASPAAFVQFSRNPTRYVPRLLGCDPVVLAETDQAVAGNIRFGAYFDGELYLFVSDETRRRFQENPSRFTRSRHVLKTGPRDGPVWR